MNRCTAPLGRFKSLAITGLTALLVACGGSSGDDDDDVVSGSSPVVARGAITQLGSIYVNGVKYETPNGGSYSDDDTVDSIANYRVGQVVSIRGRRNDDGATGVAEEVEYEAEIEGSYSNLSGQINGVTILMTPKTNVEDITGSTLIDGQRYEVSGVWIDDTTIEATYIEDDDDLEDEIKGFVEALGVSSFDVRGVTFNGYTGVPALSEGDFVEVHFDAATCTVPPNVACTLTSVELEDDFFDDAEGPEIEIEGAADFDTAGCPADADFRIDMTCIDWDSKPAEFKDGLAGPADVVEGSRVEVEGHIVGGLLIADEIKGRGNRVRVSSIAENVVAGAGTFTLIEGNISVSTMAGVTRFEDGLTFTPSENLSNQAVEVRGIRTGSSSMLAIRIKRTGLGGGGTSHELRAEVDEGGTDTDANTVTVMGVASMANSFTELEFEDVEIAPGDNFTTNADIDAFLGMIDADTNPANGPRDVIEIEIDITTGDGKATPYIADEWEIEEEDD